MLKSLCVAEAETEDFLTTAVIVYLNLVTYTWPNVNPVDICGLLVYSCADVTSMVDAVVSRHDDTTVVKCIASSVTSVLTCVDGQWTGQLVNCSAVRLGDHRAPYIVSSWAASVDVFGTNLTLRAQFI